MTIQPESLDHGDLATAPLLDAVMIAYGEALERLIADYPTVPPRRIEAALLREWEVFTSGRPATIPVAVEAGTREILERFA